MNRSRISLALVFVTTFLVSPVTLASPDTNGVNGINSTGLVDANGQLLTGSTADRYGNRHWTSRI